MVYNRKKAIEYADKWALKRNPAYYDFDGIGGDCTNFISQCIFAGSGKMNFEHIYGWYYTDLNNRAPAWTGVTFFYKFLIGNNGSGPYGFECSADDTQAGDIIQLDYGSGFQHTAIITIKSPNEILVSCHTADAHNKPLSEYPYKNIRYIHIEGVRI